MMGASDLIEEGLENVLDHVVDVALDQLGEHVLDQYINPDIPPTVSLHHVSLGYWNRWVNYSDAQFLLESSLSFHTNEKTAYTGLGQYNIVHSHINNDPEDPNNLADLDNLATLFSPTEHILEAIVVNSTAHLAFNDVGNFTEYWDLLGDVGALYPDGRPLVLEFVPATIAQFVAAIDSLLAMPDRTKLGIAIKLPAGETVPVTFDQIRIWPDLFRGLAAGPTIELSASGFDLVAHAELIDGFAATHIDKIILTEPEFGNVTFSVEQFTAGARWIALAEFADGTPLKVVIHDSGENLSEALIANTLREDLISRIEVSGRLIVDVEHARGDLGGAWTLIDDPDYLVEIRDVSEEIRQYLAQSQLPIDISRIEAIVVTDGGAISLPVGDFLTQSEAGLLARLSRDFGGVTQPIDVDISDTAENIQSHFNALSQWLEGIDRIIASDGQDFWFDPVSLLDQTTRNLINKLYDETIGARALIDIRADGQTIWAMRGELQAFAQDGYIDEIIVTDGSLPTITSMDELIGSLLVLDKLELADGTPARVALLAPYSEVSDRLDLLQDHVAHLASVGISDATGKPLIFTASQMARNSGLLAVLDGAVPLRVTGTAAEINAHHASVFALGDRIQDIWILDGAPVYISVAEAAAGVLDKLTNEGVSPGTANVYGTRADILLQLDLFQSNIDHVNAIFMTEPAPMSVPASLVQSYADVLGLIQPDGVVTRIFVVVGTPAEVTFSLDALQDIEGRISTITLTDPGLIAVSVAQLARNAEVLSRVGSFDIRTHEVAVADTFGNVQDSLDLLANYLAGSGGHVARIEVTGVGETPVFTASDVGHYASVYALLQDAASGLPLSFAVVGETSQVLNILNLLQDLSPQITRVDLTDDAGHPAISTALFLRDLGIIQKIFDADGSPLTVSLTDTGGAVGFYIDQLAANAGLLHGPITITDSAPVPLTVAQLAAHGDLLSRLVDADGTDTTLAIADSAANVLTGLPLVLANADVTSVSVVDSFANIVAAQNALAGSGAELTSIGIVDTVANALNGLALLSQEITVSSIRIVDTAANVAAHLDDLAALVGEIDGILITDPKSLIRLGTVELVTATPVLDLIENTFTIEVTGSLAEFEAGLDLPANAQLARVIIEDTAETISTNFDRIYVDGLGFSTSLDNIVVVSDNQPVAVDSVADALVLAFRSGFSLLNADGSQPQVSLFDTSAAIARDVHEFISRLPASFASVAITDGAPFAIHLSWLPLEATHDFLAKLEYADGSPVVPHYYENAQNLNEGGLALISANLERPGQFVVSDNAPLTLTAAVAVASAEALTRVLQIDGGLARNQVTDSAAAISANFDALAALPGIVGILAPDAPITLSATQITSGAAALDVIGRQYVGPSAYIDHHYKLNVVDSAGNISEAFDALADFARSGVIETIGISDAPAALRLTASQFVDDRATLLLTNTGQYPFQIVDTAAGVSAHADALGTSAGQNFQGFVVSDNEPLRGSLSFAEWAGHNGTHADGSALTFHIADTAYGITSAPLHLLDLTGVTLTGLTVLDAGTMPMGVLISLGVLGTAVTADGSPLNLEGTTAEIVASLDILQDRIDILGVVRSYNDPIVLSAAEAVEHAGVLAKLQQLSGPHNASGWGLKTLQISDTAANIADHFDQLAAIRTSTGILGVHVSDGSPVALTASQYAASATLLSLFGTLHDGPSHSSPTEYQIALTGSGIEIATLLERLQVDAHVTTIVLRDPSAPLEVDLDTVVGAGDALARIVGDYALAVTATTVELGAGLANQPDVIALDVLQANGHVATIELIDASVPLVLTPAQQAASADVLAAIVDAYYLVVGSPGAGIPYTGELIIPDGWLVDPRLLISLLTVAPTDSRYSPLVVDGDAIVTWSAGGSEHTAVLNVSGQLVVTVTDMQDVRDFATIVTTYASNGILLNSVVTYDDDSTGALAINLTDIPEDNGPITLSAANLIPALPGATLIALLIESGRGSLIDNGDGTWTFTPEPNDDSSVLFAFAFSEGTLNLWSKAALGLTSVAEAPTAQPVALTAIAEDSGARLITAAELLAGASDIDTPAGDLAITALAIETGGGALTDNGDGTWSYVPAGDDETSVTFAYTVSDGALTASSTASLDITPVNDAPAIVGGATAALSVVEGNLTVITVSASDVEAGSTVVYSISGCADAALFAIDAATGALTFRSAPDFEAPADTGAGNVYDVDVQVSDGSLASTQAIAVSVTNANEAPVARDISRQTTQQGPPILMTADFFDPDSGDAHFAGVLTNVAYGQVLDYGNGAFQYDPFPNLAFLAEGESTVESFTYGVWDAGGLSDTAIVTITIAGTNDRVQITSGPQFGTVVEDGATQAGGLIAFYDPDHSDTHTASFVAADSVTKLLGRFALTAVTQASETAGPSLGWSYVLDPVAAQGLAAGEIVTETYAVVVSDGYATSRQENIVITIEGTNDAPAAVADRGSTTMAGTPRTIAVSALLANDSDIDGDVISLVAVGAARHGSVAIDGSTVVFTPAAGYAGPASFSYTVSDGAGGSSTASVDFLIDALVSSGTNGNDGITGTGDADILAGGNGNDDLQGRSGNDRLLGGKGNDRLLGGSGSDSLNGGSGNDVLIGGVGNDRLLGGSGDDRLMGGAGNDRLSSGSGDDSLNGGSGNDELLAGAGNDRLSGGKGNDLLSGGIGDDRLDGGGGVDVLVGGAGDDDLTGGSGSDQFVFGPGGFGRDSIADFAWFGQSHDMLQLDSAHFSGFDGVIAHSLQVGSSVVIWVDGTSSITLLNTDLSVLSDARDAIVIV